MYVKRFFLFFSVTILLFFCIPTYAADHPSLLFSSSQRSAIQSRISAGGPVEQAFNAMKVLRTDEEHWPKSLAQNSFNYAVSGDSTAKNNALTIIDMYTSGEKRFSFPTATDSPRFDYGYSTPCNSLAMAYDLLYPALSDAQKNNLKSLLIEWGRGISGFFDGRSWTMAQHNFYTGLVACAGNIGLVLDGEHSESGQWVTKAENGLKTSYFDEAYNPGGDYYDGHVYQVYGAGPQFIFAGALERLKGRDIVSGKRVMAIWDYFTYAYLSQGKFPHVGDNSGLSILIGEYFYILQKQMNSPKVPGWLWVWNKIRGTGIAQNDWSLFKEYDYISMVLWYPQGVVPKNPNELADFTESKILTSYTNKTQVYPGGMAAIRNGWDERENITFWLVNRYRHQSHQHYDPNTILLSAYGEALLTNENSRSYERNLRGQLSQSNGVMIDKHLHDIPERLSHYVTGAGSSLGKFYDFFTHPLGDLLVSDSKYPHADFSMQPRMKHPTKGHTEYTNASEERVDPISKAERTVLFPKQLGMPPYIVVFDRFKKDGQTRNYSWQSYLVPGHSPLSGSGTAENPFTFTKGNAKLSLFFITPSATTHRVIPAEPGAGRGDDLLEVTQAGVAQGQFLTILYPSKTSSQQEFSVSVINNTNPVVVEVVSGQQKHILLANDSAGEVTHTSITTDAQLVILNDSEASTGSAFMVYGGKKLVKNGYTLLQSQKPVSLIARWENERVNGAGVSFTGATEAHIASSIGNRATVTLDLVYKTFDEQGQGGGGINLRLIDYFYYVVKQMGLPLPSDISVDFNRDQTVNNDDRLFFLRFFRWD